MHDYNRLSKNCHQILTDIIKYSGVDLLQAVDRVKCQTLFLSQISQKALQQAIFPVGSIPKIVVKMIAKEAGLEKISQKKEVDQCENVHGPFVKSIFSSPELKALGQLIG